MVLPPHWLKAAAKEFRITVLSVGTFVTIGLAKLSKLSTMLFFGSCLCFGVEAVGSSSALQEQSVLRHRASSSRQIRWFLCVWFLCLKRLILRMEILILSEGWFHCVRADLIELLIVGSRDTAIRTSQALANTARCVSEHNRRIRISAQAASKDVVLTASVSVLQKKRRGLRSQPCKMNFGAGYASASESNPTFGSDLQHSCAYMP